MSFGKVKPKIGGRDYLRLEEVIEQCELPGDEWVTVRFLPADIVSMKNHWIKIRTKTNKEVNLPRLCLAHSLDGSNSPRLGENGEAIECPYCALPHGNRESGAPANANVSYYANAIVREIQEDEPRKKAKHSRSEEKTGFKEVKSKSWTPVRMVRLTNTMVARIQEIGENNRVKSKKGTTVAYDVTDAKYGIDLRIKYKPKASGSDKYTIDADGSERTPLTEEELAYLTYNIDETVMGLIGLRSVAEAEEDFKTLNVVGGDVPLDDEDDDGYSLGGGDDEDDEDEMPKRKKRRAAFDDDEDDEDEKPRRKKKRSSTFDDDEDGEDGEDDEDEKPRRKKKRKVVDDEDEAPKRKKKRRPAFDEDGDEPVRKKKRKVVDGEDEPVRKKKRKVVDDEDEPVRKKKRKVVDDEDEAPKRKKKRRPAFD